MADAKQRERAKVAKARMARNAQNVSAKDRLQELEESIAPLRTALFAAVREAGRLRVSKANLESIGPSDRLDLKVDPISGDLMLTYVPG